MAISDVEVRRQHNPMPHPAMPPKGVNPAPDYLSTREFAALRAICDTLMPSVITDGDPHGFYRAAASDLAVPESVAQTLAGLPSIAQRAQLKQLLRIFGMPAINLAFAGQRTAFDRMSLAKREAVLRGWATSRLSVRRSAFLVLKKATAFYFYNNLNDAGRNPAWDALGYAGALTPPPPTPKSIVPTVTYANTTLDCDVVVVGSGAGGGVVAGELAAAGKSVVVLEAGGYYNEADFSQYEAQMIQRLYLGKGAVATADQGVAIYAGGALGGGTTVNWTTSFRTMDIVRHEWATQHGLAAFESKAYDASMDAVSARINVNSAEGHAPERDAIIERGAAALGWHNAHMPRNTRDCAQNDECGYCGLGCRRGAKQSTLKTYLQDAFDNGARIVVNCHADTIIVEQGRAAGVRATVTTTDGTHHTLTVRARVVVAAGGSIETPALLLRSRIPNPAIGRYLRLHPAAPIFAVMPQRVETWYGTMQAVYSDELTDLDGRGYGAKIESGPIHPSSHAIFYPWQSGKSHKDMMLRAANTNVIFAIVRDFGGGRVTVDRQGLPVINYQLSELDVKHARRGMEGAARIFEAAGAHEIFFGQNRLNRYRPRRDSFADFMIGADKTGYGTARVVFGSAHQMGSCRMGTDRRSSVVNPQNESHDIPGLFVADASTFPTASGTNPMLTVMSIAHLAAQYIKTRC